VDKAVNRHLAGWADTIVCSGGKAVHQMSVCRDCAQNGSTNSVVQVAIIRPGNCRKNAPSIFAAAAKASQEVVFWSPSLEGILERTLGVPLLPRAIARMAMTAAGFTAARRRN